VIELEAVEKANAELEAQIARLQTPEEIERLARERYNYVKAGTQVFAVLPEPAPNALPDEWPYNLIADLITLKLSAS
jgi:Septum formation initiator